MRTNRRIYLAKVLLLMLAVVVAAAAAAAVAVARPAGGDGSFEAYAARFGKVYATATEREHRAGIFRRNVVVMRESNKPGGNFVLGVNALADLTQPEVVARYHGFRAGNDSCGCQSHLCERARAAAAVADLNLPSSWDWRDKGVIGPVKSQAGCGACWSFAATGAMEAKHAIATGANVSLSEEQILDCSHNRDHACGGGMPSYAFQYLNATGGQELESVYPYTQGKGSCAFAAGKVQPETQTTGAFNLTSGDLDELQLKVATVGPVTVGIDANACFSAYQSGVYDGDAKPYCSDGGAASCGEDPASLTHAVIVVGYGHDGQTGLDYWWIRNSWGAQWGLGGYMKWARGPKYGNFCGLATCASYPM